MKKSLGTSFMFALLLFALQLDAQQNRMIGLWEVVKVSVGSEQMTPVAKWTRINPDGSYQSGNGWLQSAQGKWHFDPETQIYSAVDSLDISDPFGGFQVSFSQEEMYWEREEEGMTVKVTLQPIEKLPMSPADYLEGVWESVEISENGQAVSDEAQQHRLFIRWDRIYIHFGSEGERRTGYWHIHGHRPEITLLPHTEGEQPERWKIEVDEKELLMSGLSDSKRTIQRRYVRGNRL